MFRWLSIFGKAKVNEVPTPSVDVTKIVIHCLSFDYRIHVLVGPSVGACMLSEHFKRATAAVTVNTSDIERLGDGSGAAWNITAAVGVIALSSPYLSYSTVVHEVFHLVWKMLESRGISLSYATDEVFAYTLGNIAEEVISKLQEQKMHIDNRDGVRRKLGYNYIF